MKRAWIFYANNRATIHITVAWTVYIGFGVMFAVLHEEWGFVRALYFSVTALSTAGLQAPNPDSDFSMWFVGWYCLAGVPLFGLCLGQMAGILVSAYLDNKKRQRVRELLSMAEFDQAKSITADVCGYDNAQKASDQSIDWAEFLQMQFLRLGLADKSLLRVVRKQFDALDSNEDDEVSLDEVSLLGHSLTSA
eukprot:TRINITY_DN19854_c0_g1_i1.p1 TRINITY_DN19854_c0_g1~~TRINITY_DN19854_c0_g1_i1.p1  ORF type:complete len:193 (+),score=34.21 TRINITY_DN19854_c0_g1_i1:332-910(+)